jgi:hypothetical protein
MYRPSVRSLAFALALCSAFPVFGAEAVPPEPKQREAREPAETPIPVPSPIPVGFLIAWKPAILTVRVDRGAGSKYGSDGYDVTARLLGGTATQIVPGVTVIASAGLLTRYQRGTGVSGGAPEIGLLGVTSNVELEYRVAPALMLSVYVEGGLAPLPYAVESRLGALSDASEFRLRLQVSIDLTRKAAVDIGYDFTRWHASFAGTTVGNPNPDQALLLSSKDYALTIGLRWKP